MGLKSTRDQNHTGRDNPKDYVIWKRMTKLTEGKSKLKPNFSWIWSFHIFCVYFTLHIICADLAKSTICIILHSHESTYKDQNMLPENSDNVKF